MLMCRAKLIPIRLPGLTQTLPHCLRRSLNKAREIRGCGGIQGDRDFTCKGLVGCDDHIVHAEVHGRECVGWNDQVLQVILRYKLVVIRSCQAE